MSLIRITIRPLATTSKLATCSTTATADGVGLGSPRLMRASRMVGTVGPMFPKACSRTCFSAAGSVATPAQVECERRAAQPTAVELGIGELGKLVIESRGLVVVGAGAKPRRQV